MDFKAVLERLAAFFEDRGFAWAIVGGVGLGAYGMTRATVDLDFVVDARAQEEIVRFLESLGYETLYRSTGYSNHEHAEHDLGGVDFVYVRGETSRKLFGEVRVLDGPGGLRVPVPRPEHLIAMKIVAMKNDPERRYQDMADIRFLLGLPDVDRNAVRDQFEKHGLLERFVELESS